jgi:hypothetical protein
MNHFVPSKFYSNDTRTDEIVNGKKHNEIQGVLLARTTIRDDDDDDSSLLVKISQNVMECFALK